MKPFRGNQMIQKWHLENARMDVHATVENGVMVEATPNFAARCTGSSLEALISLMEERGPVKVTEE
jgi:hypothetical protein